MKQGIYVASSTPKYPLAMRYAKRDDPLCRVWRYTRLAITTRTGGLWGTTGYGGISQGLGLFSKCKDSTTLTISVAAKGATTVTVTDTLTASAYAGGYISIYESGQPKALMGIVSNTANVILLDGPLPGTYTSSANCMVLAGPYNEVIMNGPQASAGAPFAPCMGIFNSHFDEDGNDPAAGDYVWLQTWGLCNMWASGSYEGETAGEKEAVIRGDGAAQVMVDGDTYHCGFQRIGFLYPDTGDLATTANNPNPADGTDVVSENHTFFLKINP